MALAICFPPVLNLPFPFNRYRYSLTYLNRAGVIPEHDNEVLQMVLPTLVKMLQLSGAVQETAPKILGMWLKRLLMRSL